MTVVSTHLVRCGLMSTISLVERKGTDHSFQHQQITHLLAFPRFLPYIGMVTIIMNDYPYLKFLLIAVLGLFVLSSRE